jgi:ascorbate-specific PTS system EIIC-type component UlaA
MPTSLAALARSSVVHVAFAFLAMGAWAVFANRAAGMSHALIAGLVQGALSAAITLALKRFLEAASARLPGVWALIVPPTISCAVILALLLAAHILAGTRNILATISLPYAVSSTYAWVYTWAVTRRRTAGAIA